jgi:carboxymethylenebutenolidase
MSPSSLSVHQWIEISVGDRSMPVYVCTPSHGKPKGAILVIQEIFGVNPHIRSVAERFASEGYLALAPDLFHRQGNRYEAAYSDGQAAFARSQKMSEELALQDIDCVISNLDQGLRVGVIGFCMGGRLSFQASFNERVSGAVSFYGTRIKEKAIQWADHIKSPLLMFFGEKDTHIPADEISAIREILHENGKEHEIVVYPAADHGFFCDERGSYEKQAATDAWKRTVEFFARRMG